MYNDHQWFNLIIYGTLSYLGGLGLAWLGMQF